MKQLLILSFFVLMSLSTFSQLSMKSKVLNTFFIGYDNQKKVRELTNYDNFNAFIQIINENNTTDSISYVKLTNFMYEHKSCKVTLIFVNDVLYSVRFFPADKVYFKYLGYLNKFFKRTDNWKNPMGEAVWENETILITKEVDKNYEDCFVHFSKDLLKRYPQYKKFQDGSDELQ